LKPLHTLSFGGVTFSLYVGLLALAINLAVAAIVNVGLRLGRRRPDILTSPQSR
jgi:SSS family solute:Na+ symporter